MAALGPLADRDETRGEVDSTHDTGYLTTAVCTGQTTNYSDELTRLTTNHNDEPTRLTATPL